MLEAVSQFVTIVAPFLTLVGTVAVPTLVGVRLGPGRALTLAFRSRFFGVSGLRRMPDSVRAGDVAVLRQLLSTLADDAYIVVRGSKGVGKSCMVATATRSMPSVVAMTVAPGTSQEEIVVKGLAAITRDSQRWIKPLPNAERVLFWHNLFVKRPILVMNVSERPATGKYAETTGAVRELTAIGIRVIVDASDNSLEKETIATERQLLIELDTMTRDVAMSILHFKTTFAQLEEAEAGLADVVWRLVGGNPARLQRLESALRVAGEGGTAVAVGKFLGDVLADAISRRNTMLAANAGLENIIDLFKTQDEVSEHVLTDKHLTLPSPCKVLRALKRKNEGVVLVPADACMAFVLRHDLKKPPSMEQLKQMVSSEKC
jgi:hypothetical protein